MNAATIIPIIDVFLAVGVVALQIIALLLLLGLYVGPPALLAFLREHALTIGFFLSLGAALGTLYYSEVVGVIPCKLCWYQRALLYPQVFVFAYGLLKKETRVFLLGIMFSSLGLLVALYHISLPLWTSSLFCDPGTELCLLQAIKVFGYITIPVMSASVFAVLLLLSLHRIKGQTKPFSQDVAAKGPPTMV